MKGDLAESQGCLTLKCIFVMDETNNKPNRPNKTFSMLDVGGNNVGETDKKAAIIQDVALPSTAHSEPVLPTQKERKQKARLTNNSEQLLFALAELAPGSVAELLSLVTRLSSMTTEQLLEKPEGIIYLGSKYGFSYDPELTINANRFIANANLEPRTKPHLSEEMKQLSYAERYPHLQVSRKYKLIIDNIARKANTPATVILRLLLDIALAQIGIETKE